MKRQGKTTGVATQMIGQIVEPISDPSHQPSQENGAQNGAQNGADVRYRLDRLIDCDIAKRIYLATALGSNTQVVLKLILFCPDLAAEAEMLEQTTALEPFEPDIRLPYLDSFEAETDLGTALVMVMPHVNAHASSVGCRPARSIQKITSYPQLAYSTFRVRPTPAKLEVQCLESSVKEGLAAEHTDDSLLDSLEVWLAVIIGTVVFVGGMVVMTGSVLAALVVAAMLPVLFFALTGSEDRRDRIAILRLTSASEGRTFLDLTTMKRPIRDRLGRINGLPEESKLHCTRCSIKSVKVSSTLMLAPGKYPLMAQLSFTFHDRDATCKRLSIVGTYAEIRWLSQHLVRWGNQRNAD